ncbi:MAG: helix-turn-helix domain-containing protein [Egibacteraceae bacterium]
MNGGLLIKEARLRARLEPAELAERLGIAEEELATWEKGREPLSLETVVRALRACDLDLEVRVVKRDDSDERSFGRHLAMTPTQRIQHLLDLLEWERVAHSARRAR